MSSTTTVKTDAYSTLTVLEQGFTTCKLQINSAATSDAAFRIKNDAGTVITSADISVTKGGTASYIISGLKSKTAYHYYLERLEYSDYVPQIADTTKPDQMTSVATFGITPTLSVKTTSVTATFSVDPTIKGNGAPKTAVYLKSDATFTKPIATDPTNTANGLTAGTAYTFVITESGTNATISATDFTTALSGALTVTNLMATSLTINWTGGSNDAFQVLDGNGAVIVASTMGPASAVISSLKSKTLYTYKLQLQTSSGWIDQATVSATTASSVLSLNGVTDTALTANWTSAYTGASYVIEFGTSSSDKQTIATQALTTVIKNLTQATNYTFTLYIVENNKPYALGSVDISTTSASNSSSSTTSDTSVSSDTTANASSNQAPTDGKMQAASPNTKKVGSGEIVVIVFAIVLVLASAGGFVYYKKTRIPKQIQIVK